MPRKHLPLAERYFGDEEVDADEEKTARQLELRHQWAQPFYFQDGIVQHAFIE